MQEVFDLVGVGFGPSNLALATAIHENQDKPISTLFLEQQENFFWHREMLLDDTEMQISFLKDLATLRDPSSAFTFLNYLNEQGRLVSFINLKNFHPSRIEFNQYFSWAAKKLEKYVKYNSHVIDILPYGHKPYSILKVIFQDRLENKTDFLLAKNVVIATGGVPIIPALVKMKNTNQRIWHTSEYLKKISSFKKNTAHPYHFCVIGGGQSSAEIVYDLMVNFPQANITCVHRDFGYKPADESQFSNEIFNPEIVDLFYFSTNELQKKILKEHANTNYSVVDIELIQKIYKKNYENSITNNNKLCFMRFCSLISAIEENDCAELLIEDLITPGKVTKLSVDSVILATGYQYPNPPVILNSLTPYLNFTLNNMPEITRNYQIVTHPELQARIYTQGCNEYTHGLSDTLLSLGAIRAKEIIQDIAKINVKEMMYG